MYFVGQVLYYQLNIDYIIETYCVNKEKPELQCNGKCHLAQQLQVVSTNDDENGNVLTLIFESFFPVFIHEQNSVVDNFQIFPWSKDYNTNYNIIYSYNLEYCLYKPPIS